MSTITKRHQQVNAILTALQKSDDAIPFAKLCDDAGNKFPGDVVAAMYALQTLGLVEASKDGRAVAYKWVGGRPAPKRRSRAKKSDEVAAA